MIPKNSNPKVSVIVPVCNAQAYLPKCVESLLAQTYSHFEIILINDGSNDDSGLICDQYAHKDSRIKVVHKKNQGVGLARNDGIRVASGEFIFFVDADDFVQPNLLSVCSEYFDDVGIDAIIFGYKKINKQGDVVRKIIPPAIFIKNLQLRRSALVQILASGVGLGVWDKLIRTEIVKKNHIDFDTKKRGEDFTFTIKYFECARAVHSLDMPLYNYRSISGATNKYDRYFFENHVENFKMLKNFFLCELALDVSDYLDNLFILWFGVVVPLMVANTKAISFKEKLKIFEKIIKSQEIREWSSKISYSRISFKNKIIFLIFYTKHPLGFLIFGKALYFLRVKLNIKN